MSAQQPSPEPSPQGADPREAPAQPPAVGQPQEQLPAVGTAIIAMAEEDQRMRREALADPSRWDAEVDRRNTASLKEIVSQIGWPTRSKVGEHAARMAWLLVQHANEDVAFQRECLELIRSVPAGEVEPREAALLEDRVRVNEVRAQLYGTQFFTDERGQVVPRPIEDPERLDERRRAAGLEPFEDYRRTVAASLAEHAAATSAASAVGDTNSTEQAGGRSDTTASTE